MGAPAKEFRLRCRLGYYNGCERTLIAELLTSIHTTFYIFMVEIYLLTLHSARGDRVWLEYLGFVKITDFIFRPGATARARWAERVSWPRFSSASLLLSIHALR